MTVFSFYSDGINVDSLPEKLAGAMKIRGLIPPDHNRIQYCGFVSWAEGIAAFMPRNTCISDHNAESAFYLLKALQRYYLEKASGVSEGRDTDLIGNISLSLASSLAEDYLANGIYVRRKKHHTLNRGRPDWKRTISGSTPYPSGGVPVYLDVVTSQTRYVSDCETARIHARVIRNINDQYGILLFGQKSLSDSFLEQLPEPDTDDCGQLVQLEHELSQSYSERDIHLISMLKQYIAGNSGTQGDGILVGTRKFHNVWEGMLDNCLPSKIEINATLPVPYYREGEYYQEVARKGQRTDTVIENSGQSRWAVIDAKYYDASRAESAPGWHDLVKQFFYKSAAEEVCGLGVEVSLHFIFPGTNRVLKSARVGERNQGRVAVSDFNAVEKYGEVVCHYCDPMSLVRKYVNGIKLDISTEVEMKGLIFPENRFTDK